MTNVTNQTAKSYDVIVVGARCAGASTAMLLARHGARVLLLDRAQPGSDTLSTHALMRGAVFQLQNWGVLPQIIAAGTPPVRTTGIVYGDRDQIEIALKPDLGVHALYAPRRTVLDAELVRAAKESGVDCCFGVSVCDLLTVAGGAVNGVVLRGPNGTYQSIVAELVIGADGRNSHVAQVVGARLLKEATNTCQCIYGYFKGLPNRGYRWHWGNIGGGGIIPTNGDCSNVFLSVGSGYKHELQGAMRVEGFRAAMQRLMPQLLAETERGELQGRLVGFAGAKGHLRQACGNGWALVGDAGYFKDPITAHGITDALRDAQLLADSWAAGRLDDYAATRDSLSRDIFRLSDEIATLDHGLTRLAELHEALQLAIKANQNWIADNLGRMEVAA